jgi:hypothetical protein
MIEKDTDRVPYLCLSMIRRYTSSTVTLGYFGTALYLE